MRSSSYSERVESKSSDARQIIGPEQKKAVGSCIEDAIKSVSRDLIGRCNDQKVRRRPRQTHDSTTSEFQVFLW
jgi:hypothetical protein